MLISPELTDAALAEGLFTAVGRLRRHSRRAVGRPFAADGLSESQRELLRLVRRTPGVSVNDAAAELGLAANTVSTLVGQLTAAGLMERTPDPVDRRVGRLALTARARREVDAWRDRRAALAAAAMRTMEPAECEALRAALPALLRLGELVRPDGDAP